MQFEFNTHLDSLWLVWHGIQLWVPLCPTDLPAALQRVLFEARRLRGLRYPPSGVPGTLRAMPLLKAMARMNLRPMWLLPRTLLSMTTTRRTTASSISMTRKNLPATKLCRMPGKTSQALMWKRNRWKMAIIRLWRQQARSWRPQFSLGATTPTCPRARASLQRGASQKARTRARAKSLVLFQCRRLLPKENPSLFPRVMARPARATIRCQLLRSKGWNRVCAWVAGHQIIGFATVPMWLFIKHMFALQWPRWMVMALWYGWWIAMLCLLKLRMLRLLRCLFGHSMVWPTRSTETSWPVLTRGQILMQAIWIQMTVGTW